MVHTPRQGNVQTSTSQGCMAVSASSAGGSDEHQGGSTTPDLSDEEMCRGVGLEQMLDPRGVLTSRRQHTNTIIMAQDKYGINSERLRQLSMISSNYNRLWGEIGR